MTQKRTLPDRIMIRLQPEVNRKLSEIGKDMGMTKSQVITFFVKFIEALDQNEDLDKVMSVYLKKAVKELQKP